MTNKTINDFNTIATLAAVDVVLGWDTSSSTTNKVSIQQIQNFIQTYGNFTASQITDFITAVAATASVIANTIHSSSDGKDHSDVVINNAKETNATHTGDVTGATVLTIGENKVKDTHIDFGTGTNQVSSADVPEQTNLYYTEDRVNTNTNVAANTTHRISDGTDHTYINQDLRTSAATTFTNVTSSNNATANSHLVRLDQMNEAIAGIHWQKAIKDQTNFITSEPSSPTTGDRYINTVTGNSSETSQAVVINRIYEWNGTTWTEYTPTEGWAVWDIDADTNFTFNGSSWVEFGSTVSHNNTSGLQGGTNGEYYHLTSTQNTDLTDGNDSTLHYHAADRARANHTGTQTASTISDFDTEVSNNSDVVANTAKVSNATHTGDVTGSTVLSISNGAVDIAHLSASGTPGPTNFLRGDNQWATPSGIGNVSTSGSPVANDFAKFVNGTDIEGRSYAEVKTDLSLDNVPNTDFTSAVGLNTTHRTSDGTDHTYIDQDLRTTANVTHNNLTVDNGSDFALLSTYNGGNGSGFKITVDNDDYTFSEDRNHYAQFAVENIAKISGQATSATSPSFSFVNDDDTGVGLGAVNGLSLIAGGSEIQRITSTGINVTGDIVVSGTVDGIDIATDVAANTAKVSFPEAPSDGVQYARKNAGWEAVSGGSGAAATFERTYTGNVATGQLIPIIIPDELDGKDIKEVRISLAGLPGGQALKTDVRKNGSATTDSIFTSDTEIEIGTSASATNGVYQSGCDTSGSTVGSSGTSIDTARDTLAADDVLNIYITQVGSTTAGADLVVTITVA